VERTAFSGERQYTLQELADSAGVSIRTIRYYIGEGLLPGPEGAGPQSHYTASHMQRLRAIGLLKDRFLPLREIRRQIAGLDDAEIDRLIDDLGGPISSEPDGIMPVPAPGHETALDYIDAALAERPSRTLPLREERRRFRSESDAEGERWRRIIVADGVEILVREEIYRRRKDRIDWLTDWAKKVVD